MRSEKLIFLEFCMVNVNDTVARNTWGLTALDNRRLRNLIRTLNIRDSTHLRVCDVGPFANNS